MTSERLMVAFAGTELPAQVAEALALKSFAGVTLFRDANVASVEQVRELNTSLQGAARPDSRPLLIAADQEGGQLNALGDGPTQFAGAMALGAAGDTDLTERVARATAIELRAMGVNVNYMPVCDLATAPDNPAMGIRSFGDDPDTVSAHVAAYVTGLQSAGVAAAAKHFPGLGEATADTHHGIAVLETSVEQLRSRELVPFRAAIAAGAKLVMAGHVGIPSVTRDAQLPASLASSVITGLLRDELGFDGLTITDALDMRALAQGVGQVVDVITAARAGEDLMLATADAELVARVESALAQADLRRLVDPASTEAVRRRLAAIRIWLSGFDQPALDVVGCDAHVAIARELAERSITLVRNDDGLLPLRVAADTRIAVVQSEPARLTPADTSERVPPSLAAALRRRVPATDEFVTSLDPTSAEITALRDRAAEYDVVVCATAVANLRPEQAALAGAMIAANPATLVIGLRTPWDISVVAEARTYVCSYGALPPTTEALAAALLGEIAFRGRLPVEIAGMFARGHGLT